MSHQEPAQTNKRDDEDLFFTLGKEYGFDHRAFPFVLAALFHASQVSGRRGHVSAAEIADQVRQIALRQFGVLAREVLSYWGIRSTEDIGRVIHALVEKGLCVMSEDDRIEDFAGLYDFEQVFQKDYRIGGSPTPPRSR